VTYYDDLFIILTISALVIIGGIGFAVWDDVTTHCFNIKKYQLHSKIVLSVTALLLFLGTLFFFYSEQNTVLKDMTFGGKLLSSFFAAVTPRTAGFNSVDIASMSTAGKVFTSLLMFIGGSPGSTAGGVKTTTVIVIILFVVSYVKRTSGCSVFRRNITDDLIKKASTVIFINSLLIISAITLITLSQPLELSDVVLETVSAMSTVGMTSGITRDLTSFSQIVIILLMYCGRIGSLSFALSFSERRKKLNIRYPSEDILIG
jgi:trk system potassium uptake protein TrkH